MLSNILKLKLSEIDTSRNKREEIADWIINNPRYLPQTLNTYFSSNNSLLVKTAYVLEIICERELSLFSEYQNIFFKELPKITNSSALRASAKICEILCKEHYLHHSSISLNIDEQKIMTECCFNWLITEQKVACQVPAMTCLALLGMESNWIHEELKQNLIKNIPNKSAGYKARARKVLKEIT